MLDFRRPIPSCSIRNLLGETKKKLRVVLSCYYGPVGLQREAGATTAKKEAREFTNSGFSMDVVTAESLLGEVHKIYGFSA